MVDIVVSDQPREIDVAAGIKRCRKRQKIGGEQPFVDLPSAMRAMISASPAATKAHPDEGGDAPVCQGVDAEIEVEAQDRRDHQRDVLATQR